jgi:ribosomal-protein-alanine N-acetyltransferase
VTGAAEDLPPFDLTGPRLDRIETARLVLRRASMDDLPAVHAMLSDAAAMRYWSTPPHTELEQSRAWLESMVEADPALSDDFLVEREGTVIGKMGCWRLPTMGFLLRSDYWRQGYAGEALDAFLPYIAGRGIVRIDADADPRNAASMGLLTSRGFRETGRAENTWLVGDEWCDSVYFELDLAAV